ncbi:LamG-like jellyroll fold domain-containing protein [Saccharothrix sp. NRRL B-16348]|uniref:LamG-like jellyroll fold domain-containing protein n=1 Tax=Saccharothrix sp. NRRL B-16348 TaxID=1415542 RepID=UPI0009E833C7|nr:LamG-like jellyroll fold domain-containing protein [Saccharothrix sp. NRRL B-16348]
MRRLLGFVLVLALVAPVPAFGSGVTGSPSSIGVEHVLFKGGTGGYGCYRIPALVRTSTDTLLAFAEARESPSCADRGDIDIVVRRSTNDGRTWSPARVVLSGVPDDLERPFTRGNPAPVVDRTTGRVFLLSTSNEAVPGGARLPWVQHSDDDGVTWSPARQIPASFDGTTRGWFATGPSHGIQLRDGRLVVGAHQAVGDVVRAGVLYSPDHGDNWYASQTPDSHVEGKIRPGEMSVAELPNGDLYVAGRNEITTGHHRTRAISTDGGTTVSASTPVPSLTTPNVQGAVLALRNGTLLFSGPSDPQDRELMRIRYSTDGGITWGAGGLIHSGRAGYSDLAELSTGEIGLLYEGGEAFSADEIRFNRFTTQHAQIPAGTNPAVDATPAAGPTSPDTTAQANDAYVRGTVNAGLTGQADVPYSRSLDVGAQDFTVETSFRHGGSTGNQALFWAFGQGADVPQVWARIQSGRLVAWVQGTTGEATVALDNAYADNAWHKLSLARVGNRITLTVDGVSVSATGVGGAVTKTRTGLRLGSRLDGVDAFSGVLRDFSVRKAGVQVLNLPFQVVDGAVTPVRTRVALSDDLTGQCADATLLGGYRPVVAGHAGTALDVDATHPGAETPYSPTLDPGAGDFAFSLWFQHQGTANQALLWAYGATAGRPSVWVRAQPGSDRLFGWVETDAGHVSVAVDDPSAAAGFGDGAWHQLVLRRVGDRVELSVDGGAPAVATGLTGSVSNTLGVRVGSKPDGTDVLDGRVDDVRLTVGTRPVLWWGFEHQNTQAHDVVRTPSGPATADVSAYCHHSAVLGGAATTAGVAGKALAFDGVDDAVVVPYQALDGDFAIDFRMRYTAGTTDQVLVWACGVGGTERALWLRAQPSQGRLLARVQTDAGPTSVASVGAFGDGRWHHVVLRRVGGTLELLVDGTVRGSAAIKGAMTYHDTYDVDGIRIGAKPDGTDRFKGALDEFRIQRGGTTITHLPFEVVTPGPFARG